jgi:hypothetical protein
MKILSLILLGLISIGCESDPYPAGDTRVTPRAAQKDPADALSMVVQGKYEFQEGSTKGFKIKVAVPTPWAADMKVDNLPAGAVFDKDKFTISWRPGFFDGNQAGDPTIKTRVYPITIWLRSTDPNSEVRTKEVNLIVYDVPQNMTIHGRTSDSVSEGDELEYEFSISNKDYPNGPFSVNTIDMPANTRIEQVSDNEYKLILKPDHHHVKINEQDDCSSYRESCLKYIGKIIAYNPANHKSETSVEIKVKDTRLGTKIVPPNDMKQGLDITFQVSAYDLNGEVAPKIRLKSDAPDYGLFITNIVEDEETNSSVLNVTWKDIPPSYNGRDFTFRFEACSLATNGSYSNCISDSNKVSIVVKDRKSPTIDRAEWAAGEIKYLDFNSTERFTIDVTDGDNSRLDIENVVVMPKEMRKYVKWYNGNLKVNFKKPGIHQFSLVAKSEYNMTSAESFVAEVFEKNRSRTLYFTDSTRDSEVKFYRDTMGKVQLMNPVLQALNERNLSGRDTLILGTGILQDASLKEQIGRAMGKIENVVVASPLIENMPTSFIDELQKDFHISILGRYNELPNTSKLSQMHFIQREDFESTKAKVKLKETSTIESSNPLIFSVGVDRVKCEDVLDLTDKAEEARLKVGIICDRKTGGRYAILGTEFSDLLVGQADKSIPAMWLRRMLTTDLNNNKEEK